MVEKVKGEISSPTVFPLHDLQPLSTSATKGFRRTFFQTLSLIFFGEENREKLTVLTTLWYFCQGKTSFWPQNGMIKNRSEGEFFMEKEEFSEIRRHMGKTQFQLAQLLGTSLKAIQSFEQGWRNIPVHVERQLLFLLTLRKSSRKKERSCWVIQKCPMETRENCPVWEFQVGHLCWFINGTICRGRAQENWQKKMKICRQCKVFRAMLPI